MAITFPGQDDTGFWSGKRKFKRPSVPDVLGWSEKWASELQLWGCLVPDDVFDTPLYSGYSRPSDALDIARYARRDANAALIDQHNLDALRFHHGVRAEANKVIDCCLRETGITEQLLLQFKQVLPYKIALLHQIRETRPRIRFIPIWIYKRQVSPKSVRKGGEDLSCIFLDAKLAFEGLLKELHLVVRPQQSILRNILLQSRWEYSLIGGIDTKSCAANSGLIRAQSDWRRIAKTIISRENAYDGVIVFERHDMHQPYRPVSSCQDSKEAEIARLQAIEHEVERLDELAATFQSNPSFANVANDGSRAAPISRSSTPSLTGSHIEPAFAGDNQQLNQSAPESICGDLMRTQQQSSSSVVRSSSPDMLDATLLTEYQSSSSWNDWDQQSLVEASTSTSQSQDKIQDVATLPRSVTIWLEHDDQVDEYFEFPQVDCTNLQLGNQKGQPLAHEWYFQNSFW